MCLLNLTITRPQTASPFMLSKAESSYFKLYIQFYLWINHILMMQVNGFLITASRPAKKDFKFLPVRANIIPIPSTKTEKTRITMVSITEFIINN